MGDKLRRISLGMLAFLGIFAFTAVAGPYASVVSPALAQTDDTDLYDDDYDWEWDWEDEDWTTTESTELTDEEATSLAIFTGVWLVVWIGLALVFYVYSALVIQTIAKKLGEENTWLAWIPIANIALLLKMAEQSPWLVLVMFIPFLGGLVLAVLMVIAWVKIAEKRGFTNVIGLLAGLGWLIPVVGSLVSLGTMGYIAWGEPSTTAPAKKS